MKINVVYIERKYHKFVSLERVFRQIAQSISGDFFRVSFQQVAYLSTLTGIIKNLAFFKKQKADIYHITGHINYLSFILPREKTVLTIHDLNILNVKTGIRRLIIKKIFFDLPIRKLKYITAISQATKDEIIKHIGCNESKIEVVENPLDANFLTNEKAEFNKECPKILQIGTEPHKNLVGVINALENINCRLIIIGKLTAPLISLLKEKKINYQNEFEIDEKAIRQHYQSADLSVFCSIFEGFGLPIIEAQGMKTPVVTSNISPMKEVAGSGALLVDPHNYSEIEKAVKQVIDDKMLRDTLVKNGIENIKRFQPEIIAEKYADIYREILRNN